MFFKKGQIMIIKKGKTSSLIIIWERKCFDIKNHFMRHKSTQIKKKVKDWYGKEIFDTLRFTTKVMSRVICLYIWFTACLRKNVCLNQLFTLSAHLVKQKISDETSQIYVNKFILPSQKCRRKNRKKKI